MENSVKERLIEFIKYKKISNSAFCRAIGVSNAFISSMRKSLQPDKLESIALNFPDLNTGWLMTGNGEMLNPPKNDFSQISEKEMSDQNTIARLLGIIESQQKTINNMSETIKNMTHK